MSWQHVLEDHDVELSVLSPFELALTYGHTEQVVALSESSSPLSTSRIAHLPPGPGLLALPRATDTVIERAGRTRWAVVTADGDIDLRAIGIPVTARARKQNDPTKPTRRGPAPWRSMTVVRRLLAAPEPITQRRLADLAGVSQPQVHRTLRPLLGQGLAEQRASGVRIVRPAEAIEWWVERYPGPGGPQTYWTGLEPVVDQARTTVDLCRDHNKARRLAHAAEPPNEQKDPDVDGMVALSGDAAADAIAPWRLPSQAIVYAAAPPKMQRSLLVPSASATDASLVLISPKDPGVWLPRRWPGSPLPVADPLQILFDLRHAPGSDSADAYHHFKDRLLGPMRHQWAIASGHVDD